MDFKLHSEFKPTGDQPQAIKELVEGFKKGNQCQTLLGVTGSGKTFTMANVIEALNKPTLIISHNKTLAGQLYSEMKEFFPENAVEYFVSYYDYYQPEAYVPSTDTYIEKDSSVNEEIDKLRLSATASLTERRDVIVVASVSCIYGLGSPEDYESMILSLRPGMVIDRDEIIARLVDMQYERNDMDLTRSSFREIDPVTGKKKSVLTYVAIFPASHYVISKEKIDIACKKLEEEMRERVEYFKREERFVEAQRIFERTTFDLEMLRETGTCSGIENYAPVLAGLKPRDPPHCLMDFFKDDFLMIIDESHISIPQIGGMYAGDRARKNTLVDFGFRLPSALDNRPLSFNEFEDRIDQLLCVSATPSKYEEEHELLRTEQIIRPTGLLDPEIFVRPTEGQIDDLISEINKVTASGNKVLVTTLTKRMAEDLTDYLKEVGLRVKYLHSDFDTLERAEIIRDMRLDVFDVLVGINLLREGLDIPEISLVAIIDADKEGFLRSATSLIQTVGRAARNSEGHVIMYADKITDSMKVAIDETKRRRAIQEKYNEENGIVPTTIKKAVRDVISISKKVAEAENNWKMEPESMNLDEINKLILSVEKQMKKAALELDFENAAMYRDQVAELKKIREQIKE